MSGEITSVPFITDRAFLPHRLGLTKFGPWSILGLVRFLVQVGTSVNLGPPDHTTPTLEERGVHVFCRL